MLGRNRAKKKENISNQITENIGNTTLFLQISSHANVFIS